MEQVLSLKKGQGLRINVNPSFFSIFIKYFFSSSLAVMFSPRDILSTSPCAKKGSYSLQQLQHRLQSIFFETCLKNLCTVRSIFRSGIPQDFRNDRKPQFSPSFSSDSFLILTGSVSNFIKAPLGLEEVFVIKLKCSKNQLACQQNYIVILNVFFSKICFWINACR